jgi:protein phosphatase
MMTLEAVSLKFAGHTDTGRNRDHNEDCIGFDTGTGVAVLADGMGGHKAGEIASRMAVEQVLRQLRSRLGPQTDRSITGSQMLRLVSNTISTSNRRIFEASEAHSARNGMGTTVVAAVFRDSRLYGGHVGDSRMYLLRDRCLKRITKDHSLVQDLVDKGFYTEDEAKLASINHVVTRALGTAEDVEVDIFEQDTETDDLYLLCSDGLTDMLSDDQMEKVLQETDKDLNEKARKLIEMANQEGGKDNISVILIKVPHFDTIDEHAPDGPVLDS